MTVYEFRLKNPLKILKNDLRNGTFQQSAVTQNMYLCTKNQSIPQSSNVVHRGE